MASIMAWKLYYPVERMFIGTNYPLELIGRRKKNYLGTDDPVEQMILWKRLSFDKWSRGTDYSVEQMTLWNRLSFDKWLRGTDYSVEQMILWNG